MWGKDESGDVYSGPGSHDPEVVASYVKAVAAFLGGLPGKPDVVDLGCGDFNVGRQLRELCGRYTACDVVPFLIERNRKKFGGLGVEFKCVDITSEDLPPGDVVFLRQVLQHLTNAQIPGVLQRLGIYRYLVLTEHLPARNDFVPNRDKPVGMGTRFDDGTDSGVVLTVDPFNLRAKSQRVICEVPQLGGTVRTTVYEL